jgi:hypothetical protein
MMRTLLGLLVGLALASGADAAPHVVLAGAASDTLAWELDRVLPVAVAQLQRDDWTIQRADTAAGAHRLVTRWKPIKHVLARVFLDDVLARCVVDLAPVPGGRTLVTIQGGLASNGDLEASPAFPAAQISYRRAAERWLARVQGALSAQSAVVSPADK